VLYSAWRPPDDSRPRPHAGKSPWTSHPRLLVLCYQGRGQCFVDGTLKSGGLLMVRVHSRVRRGRRWTTTTGIVHLPGRSSLQGKSRDLPSRANSGPMRWGRPAGFRGTILCAGGTKEGQ
jgi:hypothetical protein